MNNAAKVHEQACWLCDEHDGTELQIAHFRIHARCAHVLINLIADAKKQPSVLRNKDLRWRR